MSLHLYFPHSLFPKNNTHQFSSYSLLSQFSQWKIGVSCLALIIGIHVAQGNIAEDQILSGTKAATIVPFSSGIKEIVFLVMVFLNLIPTTGEGMVYITLPTASLLFCASKQDPTLTISIFQQNLGQLSSQKYRSKRQKCEKVRAQCHS